MISFGDITVALTSPHVALVELARPPHNFFDLDLLEDLVRACNWVEVNGGRAIVLASQGRNFCAGANFASDVPDIDAVYRAAVSLFEQPLPIVAAVQGAAVGGGLGLALAADFRVATRESRFVANFAMLGIHQGFGLSETLPATIGLSASADLLYRGQPVNGTEARSLGLCDRLASLPELRSVAIAWATELAAAAPLAVRAIRRTLRRDLVRRVKAAVEHEGKEQLRLMQTADWDEGRAAAAERRSPIFAGR